MKQTNNTINNSENVNQYRVFMKKGLFAGLASATSIISYPLEVLKIRSQVLESKDQTKHLIRKMLKEEGIKSFYKGISQNLLLGFIGYGTLFFSLEAIKYNLNKHFNFSQTLNSVISSVLAGMIAATIASPFNFVKTRQILYKGDKNDNYKMKTQSMINIIKDIYSEKNSIIGFWKALNPSLLTSFYSAIQMASYEILTKQFIDSNNPNIKLSTILGSFSRMIAATVIFPVHLLRSRMLNFQSSNIRSVDKEHTFFVSKKEYKKVIGDIIFIFKNEGFSSLFRGLKFELVKAGINGFLFFYAYEYLNKNL